MQMKYVKIISWKMNYYEEENIVIQIVKRWKNVFFALAAVLVGVSVTATATEPTESEPVTDGYHVTLAGEANGYFYTGYEIKPEVEKVVYVENGNVTQEFATDSYEVSYPDADAYVNAGEYKVLVTLESEQPEEEPVVVEKKFEIKPISIDNVSVTLGKTSYDYTGEAHQPTVKITMDEAEVADTNYNVEYAANVEPGTAKVIITGKENLTGTKEIDFEINFGKPTIRTTPSYNQINVVWDEVPGATKYEVYYQTSETGTQKKLATVQAGKSCNYRHKDRTSGKTYFYMVRAIRVVDGVEVSSDSDVVMQRVQPYQASITEVLRMSATSLKVKWKKVSGAHGYRIYRSTSEDGEYTKIATVTSGSRTYYTDSKRTCGRVYYYKVQAYRKVNGKYIYGYESEPYGRNTRPSKSDIYSSTKYTSTTLSLKWKKISYATGYEIYRSTSKDGEYEVIADIESGTKTSYKLEDIDSTQRYYFKIRAYRDIDGQRVYGRYSDSFLKRAYGWQYVNGYKLYYTGSGKLVKDVRNKIGKQDSYAIKVNRERNCITVYAKDGDKGYTIPVVAFICSTAHPSIGKTPLGTFYTPAKYRWATLMGPSYGQWSTTIKGGILFHSVAYNKKDNRTLGVGAYNKLGQKASHGCVRMKAGDAKWIYDNCPKGTQVTVYESSTSGPFGKPGAYKLPSWHKWDPTDPTAKKYCRSRGCH